MHVVLPLLRDTELYVVFFGINIHLFQFADIHSHGDSNGKARGVP